MTTDLFIMSGQSNMEGQSEGKREYAVRHGAALEYRLLDDTLVDVANPCGEDIVRDGELLLEGAAYGYASLHPAFADAYSTESGRHITLVPAAKGATVVEQWLCGTPLYNLTLEKTNAAIAALKKAGYEIAKRCFVWLQGESDGIAGVSRELYKERVLAMWSSLKSELDLDYFLIIRVGRFHDFPVYPIMEAQEELCRDRDDFVMLTRVTQSFTIENGLMQGDTAPFHYTNLGYECVGHAAGKNAARFITGRPVELEKEEFPLKY